MTCSSPTNPSRSNPARTSDSPEGGNVTDRGHRRRHGHQRPPHQGHVRSQPQERVLCRRKLPAGLDVPLPDPLRRHHEGQPRARCRASPRTTSRATTSSGNSFPSASPVISLTMTPPSQNIAAWIEKVYVRHDYTALPATASSSMTTTPRRPSRSSAAPSPAFMPGVSTPPLRATPSPASA